MPNHVQNVLSVTGPNAHAALAKYFRAIPDAEDARPPTPTFDFNLLIPMPACLEKVVENGIAGDVLAILSQSSGMTTAWDHLRRFDREGHMGIWQGLFGYKRGEIAERIERAFPGSIANARAMALAIGETGFKSWYDWSIVNWGTKWNAYDATIEGDGNQARLRFQTAWASPAPVLTALAAAERDLTFQYWAFDEGWNFYAVGGGVGEIRIDERKSPERNDPAVIEAHRVCYGRDPEDDEEEDDGDED